MADTRLFASLARFGLVAAVLVVVLIALVPVGRERGREEAAVPDRRGAAGRELCGTMPDEPMRCPSWEQADPRGRTMPFPPRVALPVVTTRVEPVYPDVAREKGVTGTVVVDAGIRADGTVGGVCVVKPLPCGLNRAAVDAVARWRFEAPRRNVVARVTISFTP